MKYYRSEKFWIEWLTVVPLAIALGVYFYGQSFYSSFESFLSRTLIIVIVGTIISVLNHLVRFYALYYFHKLNQWTIRITLSLIAYLIAVSYTHLDVYKRQVRIQRPAHLYFSWYPAPVNGQTLLPLSLIHILSLASIIIILQLTCF